MPEVIGAANAVAELKQWSKVDGPRDAIERCFEFPDFKTAFAFMTATALKAEQMDHHPEWFNVYARVDVVLSTHDAKGVTERDMILACFMDELAEKLV